MKKIRKIIIVLISIISIAILSIITYNVFAEEKLLIKDIKYGYNALYNTGILYSDNRLLTWGTSGDDVIYENVKDYHMINHSDLEPIILTNDGILKINLDSNNRKAAENTCQAYGNDWHAKTPEEAPDVYENSTKWYCCAESADYSGCFESDVEYMEYENSGKREIENVVSFDYENSSYNGQALIYLDNENNLYDTEEQIASNIKQYKIDREGGDILNLKGETFHMINYLTQTGELYTNGLEIFDLDQIENIEEIMSTNPKYIKLADNVAQIGENYYLTTSGDMYIFGVLPREEDNVNILKLASNVKNILYEKDNLYNIVYHVEFNDGTKRLLTYGYEESPMEIEFNNNIKDINSHIDEGDGYFFTYLINDENGNLFKFRNGNIEKIGENVKEIEKVIGDPEDIWDTDIEYSDYYILNNDNEIFYKCFEEDYCDANDFVRLFNSSEQTDDGMNKVIENIKTSKYISFGIMITNDNKVLRIGNSRNNEFKNGWIYDSYYTSLPVQIDELINDGKEIIPLGIVEEPPKKGVAGTWEYAYPQFYPANTEFYDIDIVSEDESIAIYETDGISYLKEGETKICYISDLYNIEKCSNLKVYPEITSVSVREGTNINMDVYEGKLINLDVLPDNAIADLLSYNLSYSSETAENMYIEHYRYYDEEMGEYVYLKQNQFYVSFYTPGVYTLTIIDTHGKYEIDIHFNVEQKVNWIQYQINEENYDGVSRAFMFLNEEKTLQVETYVYPEDAGNKNLIWKSSNEKVATVDQNGMITAHKVGETNITIESEDGNATESFKLFVYDYTKQNRPGDINNDGQVDILDVIKLRRHLAGLEVFDNE